MGTTVGLTCNACGFASGPMALGGGFADFTWRLSAPALCRACRTLVLDNYLRPARQCPGCRRRGTLAFYNEPELHQAPGAPATRNDGEPPDWDSPLHYKTTPGQRARRAPELTEEELAAVIERLAPVNAATADDVTTIFDWQVGDSGQRFRLPDDSLLCPRCGQFTMQADLLALWD